MATGTSSLSRVPAFRDLSATALRRIARVASEVTAPARWAIIHENTPGDACYILLKGKLAVFDGREKIAELGPGEVVGEAALRKDSLRTATVSTLEPVELLRIEKNDFDALVRDVPKVREAIDATLRRHLGDGAGTSG